MNIRQLIIRVLEMLCIPFSKCSHFKSSCCECQCDKDDVNNDHNNNDHNEDNNIVKLTSI